MVGLHYIALASYLARDRLPMLTLVLQSIGLTLAAQICLRLLDRTYKHLKAKHGGEGKPEYRLRTLQVVLKELRTHLISLMQHLFSPVVHACRSVCFSMVGPLIATFIGLSPIL